ncbi:hypothetical protein HY988_03085 [Candidatus Micrarchaeota archaeon]|nr:hypothetical protein [Candidatus Micrarchaeota archaeon]
MLSTVYYHVFGDKLTAFKNHEIVLSTKADFKQAAEAFQRVGRVRGFAVGDGSIACGGCLLKLMTNVTRVRDDEVVKVTFVSFPRIVSEETRTALRKAFPDKFIYPKIEHGYLIDCGDGFFLSANQLTADFKQNTNRLIDASMEIGAFFENYRAQIDSACLKFLRAIEEFENLMARTIRERKLSDDLGRLNRMQKPTLDAFEELRTIAGLTQILDLIADKSI